MWRADSLWNEEALRVLREDILATVRGVVEAGKAACEFPAGLDADMAARVILGMVAMAALGRNRLVEDTAPEERTPEDFAPELLDMALAMVRA